MVASRSFCRLLSSVSTNSDRRIRVAGPSPVTWRADFFVNFFSGIFRCSFSCAITLTSAISNQALLIDVCVSYYMLALVCVYALYFNLATNLDEKNSPSKSSIRIYLYWYRRQDFEMTRRTDKAALKPSFRLAAGRRRLKWVSPTAMK